MNLKPKQNEKPAEMFLCVPCREALNKAGFYIKYARNARDKGTCDRCERRRFGAFYEVTKDI